MILLSVKCEIFFSKMVKIMFVNVYTNCIKIILWRKTVCFCTFPLYQASAHFLFTSSTLLSHSVLRLSSRCVLTTPRYISLGCKQSGSWGPNVCHKGPPCWSQKHLRLFTEWQRGRDTHSNQEREEIIYYDIISYIITYY